MTVVNHIAGGIVFTGIFSSFFNVNIFENPYYLVLTIFCALLPDIDTTKSLIGKVFYPISRFIFHKYGHRTITHSLVFLFGMLGLGAILENLYFPDYPLKVIFFFAVFSHIVLDMITIQGVPLLYPFRKNPCVIPGNIEYRVTTGNLKQEGVFLFIFALLIFSLNSLFSQGFWTSYNQKFNDIKHTWRESKNSPNLYLLKYDYINYGERHEGKAIITFSTENELIFLDTFKRELHNIKKGQQGIFVNQLKPIKTKHFKKKKDIILTDEKLAELNRKIKHKYIIRSNLIANKSLTYKAKTGFKSASKLNLEKEYNVNLIFQVDDSLFTVKKEKAEKKYLEHKTKLLEKLALYYEDITLKSHEIRSHNSKFKALKIELKQEERNLTHLEESYEINKAKKHIMSLKREVEAFKLKDTNILNIKKIKIESLKKEIEEVFEFKEVKENTDNIRISGSLEVLSF